MSRITAPLRPPGRTPLANHAGPPRALIARPSREAVDRFLRQTRLLGYREMRELFPDCEIRRERFLGLTKAYVAVRLAKEVR